MPRGVLDERRALPLADVPAASDRAARLERAPLRPVHDGADFADRLRALRARALRPPACGTGTAESSETE